MVKEVRFMRESKLNELREKIERFKILSLRKVERECEFLNIEPYEVRLKNGEIFGREKIVKGGNSGSAAVVLPFISDDEVLITIEPRVFTEMGVGVGLTAGYIENGEDDITAARRELLEETGYIAETIIPIGGFYQDVGISGAYNKLFIANGLKKVSERHLDSDEYIQNMVVTFDELLELIDLGYAEDANTVIASLRAEKVLRKVR